MFQNYDALKTEAFFLISTFSGSFIKVKTNVIKVFRYIYNDSFDNFALTIIFSILIYSFFLLANLHISFACWYRISFNLVSYFVCYIILDIYMYNIYIRCWWCRILVLLLKFCALFLLYTLSLSPFNSIYFVDFLFGCRANQLGSISFV